ncbi:MAG TPA: EAL domain-containing protein [Mycobacteriales bacterium]|jgi:diguanylate cyclase (GGDEF)-like protein/PAS domain S-box-containing protein|nr:EAL domain-containing protein [Mycobacteriales bacterium]
MSIDPSPNPPDLAPLGGDLGDLSRVLDVLLVEDDAGDAMIVMSALEENPGQFHVHWVTSLEAARSTLEGTRFQCLVVDLRLPDADGLAVIDTLRAAASDSAIVVLTGSVDDELGIQAIARGADDYLVKDQLVVSQLRRTVWYAVERARTKELVRRLSAHSVAVMSAMSDAIIVVGADGLITSVNRAAEALLELPAQSLLGQSISAGPWSLIDNTGSEVYGSDCAVLGALSTGRPMHGVVAGVRRAGRDVAWVEVTASLLHQAGGQLDGVVVSMRDISERLSAERSTRFQAAMLAAVGQAVVVTDPSGNIVFWNPAATALFGWTEAEALGRPAVELVPNESEDKAEEIRQLLRRGESWTGDFLVRGKNGRRFSVLMTDTPVFDETGELTAVIGVSTDISERKRAEEAASELSAIVESSCDAILTTASNGTILTWNRGAEELFGFSAREVVGRDFSRLQPAGTRPEMHSILLTIWAGGTVRGLETVRYRKDGARISVSLTVSPIFDNDGRIIAASAIVRDISDRRRLEQELTRQAMHDALTGLPNRTLLIDRLSQALASAGRRGAPVAVLFCDLDNFKTVNDASGHDAGDALLVEVARRLRATIRPADTVARFGGDEFVVVCEDADAIGAQQVAERVAATLREPIILSGQRLFITASIGIAVSPTLPAHPETLLRSADSAMYDAKAHGRARWRLFDTSVAAHTCERLELTNELRDALAADTLQVHYQPVMQCENGQLGGVEALVRWQHPRRGWVSPATFVPLAEETGLIWELDRWVLSRACRDAAAMRASGVLSADARLAVNISACNIGDPELITYVENAASGAGLPFDALELEVTETGLMADAASAEKVLQGVRELGIGVALDDFGTGYSSLTNVRQLPVTTLKIDLGFIQHITSRPEDLAIVTAIIDLAHAVGLRTVAEGVETPEQLSLLHRMGCSAGQGYLWSPALPPSELAAHVATARRGRPAASLRHGMYRTV